MKPASLDYYLRSSRVNSRVCDPLTKVQQPKVSSRYNNFQQQLNCVQTAKQVQQQLSLGTNNNQSAALIDFFNNRGFTDAQVRRVTDFLLEQGMDCHNQQYLEQQLKVLQELMPGINFITLVGKYPCAIIIDPQDLVSRLIFLRSVLENRDAVEVAFKHPKLLTCDSLQDKFFTSCDVLKQSLPMQYSMEYIVSIISQEPELIFRLQTYQGKGFSELPIDVQNLLTIAGGGGGASYKSWSRQPTIVQD